MLCDRLAGVEDAVVDAIVRDRVAAMITTLAPDVLARGPDPALDARIAAAFADDAKSVDVSRLLPEVQAAAKAADTATGEARARALDPLLSRDDVKVALAGDG